MKLPKRLAGKLEILFKKNWHLVTFEKIAGRNFDWPAGEGAVVINPRNIARQSMNVEKRRKPLRWVSKYGSVTLNLSMEGQLVGSVDGMNEYGLAAGSFWLEAAVYPEKDNRPALDDGLFVQYCLDNYKTVDELLTSVRISGIMRAKRRFLLPLKGEKVRMRGVKNSIVPPEMEKLNTTPHLDPLPLKGERRLPLCVSLKSYLKIPFPSRQSRYFGHAYELLDALPSIRLTADEFSGMTLKLHYFMHDQSGDSAIVEYLDGKLIVYTGDTLTVQAIANDPYRESLTTLKEYKAFGGTEPLPGGYSSSARFVRAAAFLKRLPKVASGLQAISFGFDAMADVAAAPGTKWPTQWSIVRDLVNKKIYFRTADNANIRSVDLKDIDFAGDQRSRVLDVNAAFIGNITNRFKPNKVLDSE
ncbi:linear amide C-N hydrolase [Candidatus Omnitrophota bacterium]